VTLLRGMWTGCDVSEMRKITTVLRRSASNHFTNVEEKMRCFLC